MKQLACVHITPTVITVNYHPLDLVGEGASLLKAVYKQYVNDYPKFYKMDALCRLGFIASELLLQLPCAGPRFIDREDRAIVLLNQHASKVADRKYETTIISGENYFPSPADFVYTLPNIVTGEIAIRNHYFGESNFIVTDHFDPYQMETVIRQSFRDPMTTSILGGWIECVSDNEFEASLALYVQS